MDSSARDIKKQRLVQIMLDEFSTLCMDEMEDPFEKVGYKLFVETKKEVVSIHRRGLIPFDQSAAPSIHYIYSLFDGSNPLLKRFKTSYYDRVDMLLRMVERINMNPRRQDVRSTPLSEYAPFPILNVIAFSIRAHGGNGQECGDLIQRLAQSVDTLGSQIKHMRPQIKILLHTLNQFLEITHPENAPFKTGTAPFDRALMLLRDYWGKLVEVSMETSCRLIENEKNQKLGKHFVATSDFMAQQYSYNIDKKVYFAALVVLDAYDQWMGEIYKINTQLGLDLTVRAAMGYPLESSLTENAWQRLSDYNRILIQRRQFKDAERYIEYLMSFLENPLKVKSEDKEHQEFLHKFITREFNALYPSVKRKKLLRQNKAEALIVTQPSAPLRPSDVSAHHSQGTPIHK